ncbi:MAG: tautomerase family protein [Anaerolineaceae bacterium]|nr:tautomerase family protein [Anaerolineaceae bacterium]MCB9099368.1 tautomerase family protein [Anaerolineales bacterium]
MPLVQIALRAGTAPSNQRAIADGVHQALVETINVPPADRFQLITEYAADHFIYDSLYLNIPRTDQLVILQITISFGRTVEQKRALYRRITELLAERPGLRPEDVFITLIEVAKENWSFGQGIAQYAPE